MANERKGSKGRRMGTVLLRSALIACAASVVLVVAFAFVLQKQWLGIEAAAYVNAGIKTVSAIIAAVCASRAAQSRTILWAAASGGLYMLITFLVFSLLSGGFAPRPALLLDLVLCMLGGAVVGAIRNLRR